MAYTQTKNEQFRQPSLFKTIQKFWVPFKPVTVNGVETYANLPEFRLETGKTKNVAIVQELMPYRVHYVKYLYSQIKTGRFAGKKFSSTIKLRCLKHKFTITEDSFTEDVYKDVDCPFCNLMGLKENYKPAEISIGGVVEGIEAGANGKKIFTDKDTGITFENLLPKILFIVRYDIRQAIMDGLSYAAQSYNTVNGVVFKVTRDKQDNSVAIGSWAYVPREPLKIKLDKELNAWILESNGKPVYYNLDYDKALPILDGKDSSVFPAEKHAEHIKNLIERHVRCTLQEIPDGNKDAIEEKINMNYAESFLGKAKLSEITREVYKIKSTTPPGAADSLSSTPAAGAASSDSLDDMGAPGETEEDGAVSFDALVAEAKKNGLQAVIAKYGLGPQDIANIRAKLT